MYFNTCHTFQHQSFSSLFSAFGWPRFKTNVLNDSVKSAKHHPYSTCAPGTIRSRFGSKWSRLASSEFSISVSCVLRNAPKRRVHCALEMGHMWTRMEDIKTFNFSPGGKSQTGLFEIYIEISMYSDTIACYRKSCMIGTEAKVSKARLIWWFLDGMLCKWSGSRQRETMSG